MAILTRCSLHFVVTVSTPKKIMLRSKRHAVWFFYIYVRKYSASQFLFSIFDEFKIPDSPKACTTHSNVRTNPTPSKKDGCGGVWISQRYPDLITLKYIMYHETCVSGTRNEMCFLVHK